MSTAGINESGYLDIGGIPQWVQIRGDDVRNPVLFFLHGGPGGSALVLGTAWRPWENRYTIVHWDQRGSGRTFEKNGATGGQLLTIDRMAADGLAVVEHLRGKFPGRPIILMGHSWGTVLGVTMIRTRPDWFAAYVGVAQVTNTRRNGTVRFEKLVAKLRAQGLVDETRALESIGPPPYGTDGAKWATLQRAADALGADPVTPKLPRPLPPEIRPTDREIIGRGMVFSRQQVMTNGEFGRLDLAAAGTKFAVPMFLISGAEDFVTPWELAEEFCRQIEAPHKEFVRIEGEGHFFPFNAPEKLFAEIEQRVGPRLG
ncbi:MAG TPA: alpha/beta hydrolase [Candidatus Didemnitutus sp.]|nr:alpha/beta hydrolase [Candidatus Didemnitutus sp.]